jgi:hypothetical protein
MHKKQKLLCNKSGLKIDFRYQKKNKSRKSRGIKKGELFEEGPPPPPPLFQPRPLHPPPLPRPRPINNHSVVFREISYRETL